MKYMRNENLVDRIGLDSNNVDGIHPVVFPLKLSAQIYIMF